MVTFTDGVIDGYAEGEEPIVFHHKNGEFRKYESQAIRDLATGQNQPARGLFKSLVSTKGNRLMFVAMVLCFALVFIVSILSNKPNENTLDGVYCKMDAFSIEESVYVSIAMHLSSSAREKSDSEKPRHFFAEVTALDSSGEEAGQEKLDFLYSFSKDDGAKDQFLRTSFSDYEIEKIKCTLFLAEEGNEQSVELSCGVVRH